MRNIIMKRPGESAFVTWTKKRIVNNLNFIALFQGPTGIGKTWAAISYAYEIDPDFSIDQVVFDFQEFMDVLNADWFKKKKWKTIIWDEPQVTISNRNWQSAVNKMMNYILSTFRHQNIILLFAAPYKDFMDSQSVKLLHCIFKCRGVNSKMKVSRVRPLLQEYNADMGKMYQHSLYVTRRGIRAVKLKVWPIHIPPKNLIDDYEKKKTKFTTKLNENIKEQVSGLDKKKETVERKPYITPRHIKIMKMTAEGVDDRMIAKELDMKVNDIARMVDATLKKGYTIEEFKEKSPKKAIIPPISAI